MINSYKNTTLYLYKNNKRFLVAQFNMRKLEKNDKENFVRDIMR